MQVGTPAGRFYRRRSFILFLGQVLKMQGLFLVLEILENYEEQRRQNAIKR